VLRRPPKTVVSRKLTIISVKVSIEFPNRRFEDEGRAVAGWGGMRGVS
jgi:hypothetical protein